MGRRQQDLRRIEPLHLALHPLVDSSGHLGRVRVVADDAHLRLGMERVERGLDLVAGRLCVLGRNQEQGQAREAVQRQLPLVRGRAQDGSRETAREVAEQAEAEPTRAVAAVDEHLLPVQAEVALHRAERAEHPANPLLLVDVPLRRLLRNLVVVIALAKLGQHDKRGLGER